MINIYSSAAQAVGAADKVMKWIAREPLIRPPPPAAAAAPASCRGDLKLNNVNFGTRYGLSSRCFAASRSTSLPARSSRCAGRAAGSRRSCPSGCMSRRAARCSSTTCWPLVIGPAVVPPPGRSRRAGAGALRSDDRGEHHVRPRKRRRRRRRGGAGLRRRCARRGSRTRTTSSAPSSTRTRPLWASAAPSWRRPEAARRDRARARPPAGGAAVGRGDVGARRRA